MDREQHGGWVYIMADRYRGTTYVGSTADLALRVAQHREGQGSKFCAEYGLTRLVWAEPLPTMRDVMDQEKRIKRWRRDWKFALIEKANPGWRDLFEDILN
ncbi:GIY-YIG nuclease family protein [Porphyrobacter sp. ULC335]|jgi:putative endonuclease|uniref:GIY-YIG nuclease family protein n=1 Tax=Porphyrobacter sp. ULC335 TaxID=2854260 RepID=UPI00221E8F6B|nr:GIY-YIG nuclease family protein [Porphyrobacter sp. ULC335]UYV17215.1 GIY-YIG nuclease family protein [Porphyrobacter sp. ULC335]